LALSVLIKNGKKAEIAKGLRPAVSRQPAPHNIYYGTAIDLVIKIAQDTTPDALQKLKIRTFLQALISLSCRVPLFLVSARILSKPLALISVALLLATQVFLGHAFINP
jgi:hypothetical protein